MISANTIIEERLSGIMYQEQEVAVALLFYEGHGEPYIVYSEIHKDRSYAGDNLNEGFFSNIDVSIYSTSNYLPIVEEVLSRLEGSGFIYQPNKDSPDLYDPDTRYFHKTLCFAYPIQRYGEGEPEEFIPSIDDTIFPVET